MRNLGGITKEELRKKGLREYFDYGHKGEIGKFELGVIREINELLKKHDCKMVLAGMDRDNYYLFKILKDE